jgi:3-hydroxyisobutyrate/3-hydroxypropionate dehydrogenase
MLLRTPRIMGPTRRAAARRYNSTATTAPTRYGFVGLGQMGYPMAMNLLRNAASSVRSTFTVYDVNPLALSQFVNESETLSSLTKVLVAKTPRELAEQSVPPSPRWTDLPQDTIITMLPESSHVEQVFENPETGFLSLHSTETPKLFIDSSTISPFYSLSLATKVVSATHLSAHLLDAPVSGGVSGAQRGTLTFMLGAPKELVPHVSGVLSHMGSKVMWCGPPSSGLGAKLANNYILAAMNIATCEAMNFGLRMGLDSEKLAEVINSSTGANWCSRTNNPVAGVSPGAPAEKDYEGGFGARLMRKDLRLAVEAAENVDAKIALGKEMERIYDQVVQDEKFKNKDFSVVYRWLGGDE